MLKRTFRLMILSLFAIAMLYSCASQKQVSSGLEGDYVEEDSFDNRITLSKNRYVMSKPFAQAHMSPFVCCDTLSMGTWEMTKGSRFIELTSDLQTEYPFLPMEVAEQIAESKDSLYFYIDNPIEKFQQEKNGHRSGDLYYMIEVSSNSQEFDLQTSFLRFNTNRLVLAKPRALEISKFEIIAIPKQEMKVRNIEVRSIYMQEHLVQDTIANQFRVNIPTLNYQLISQLRLTKEFVRIVSPTQLEWNGKRYLKK